MKTQRKPARSGAPKAKRSRAQMAVTFFDALSDAVALIDATGRVLAHNAAFANWAARPGENLDEKNFYHFFADGEGGRLRRKVQEALKTGRPIVFEDGRQDRFYVVSVHPAANSNGAAACAAIYARDETERLRSERTLSVKLRQAATQVETLKGLLPICAACKRIRDDKGYWNRIESYITQRSEAEFSHSLCPECAQRLYPEFCKKGVEP